MTLSRKRSAPLKEQLAVVWRRLRGGELSPLRASASVAVGMFVAALPVYGLQLFIVLAMCVPLRLDAALAYIAAHVSNPLTLPLLLVAEVEVGALILTGEHAALTLEEAKEVGIGGYLAQLAIGAPTVGIFLAAIGALGTMSLARWRAASSTDPISVAVRRTLDRYARESIRTRTYLSSKLRDDPALKTILGLAGDFDSVFDAGCGFGQLGLCLLDAGRATRLVGVDANPERIAVARRAAGSEADYSVADVAKVSFPRSDTILLVDTLHYLNRDDQDRVLREATGALEPGGRIVVREADPTLGLRSRLTTGLERLAAIVRGQPSQRFAFRSSTDLVEVLEALGLVCSELSAEGSPFSNIVIVAEKAKRPHDQLV